MDLQTRIVTRVPLDALWTQGGGMDAIRLRELGRGEIRELLRAGTIHFVRADAGRPLEWIDEARSFDFWKSEVRTRPVHPAEARFALDDYRGGTCFLASEWRAEGRPPIILVEQHH